MAWFMAPIEYRPNGKGIIVSIKYTTWFIAPMEKAWFNERLFFKVVIIIFLLYEVNKSNVTSSFRGIWTSSYCFAIFFFSPSLSIDKRSTNRLWFLRACSIVLYVYSLKRRFPYSVFLVLLIRKLTFYLTSINFFLIQHILLKFD